MRKLRLKNDGEGFYHVGSRCVDRTFRFDDDDKTHIVDQIRRMAAFCGMEVNTYSVMTNHFHILLHVLPERELTDDELASRVAALYGHDRAEECRSAWAAYRRDGCKAAMQRLEEERGALLRRIPYLTLQLIRPVSFTVQIVLKRLWHIVVLIILLGELTLNKSIVGNLFKQVLKSLNRTIRIEEEVYVCGLHTTFDIVWLVLVSQFILSKSLSPFFLVTQIVTLEDVVVGVSRVPLESVVGLLLDLLSISVSIGIIVSISNSDSKFRILL